MRSAKFLSTMTLVILILLDYRSSYRSLLAQNTKHLSTLDHLGIKGKVKSITDTVYMSYQKSNSLQKGNIISTSISTFNTNGNKIEEKTYSPDGNESSRDTNIYDNHGNLIELIQFEKEVLNLRTKNIYDKTSKLVESDIYNSCMDLVYKYLPEYDENDNLIKAKTISQAGREGFIFYSVDEMGREIESRNFIPQLETASIDSFRYDIEGKLIDNSYYMCLNYKYTADGNIIEDTSALEYLLVSRNSTKYEKPDSNGNFQVIIKTTIRNFKINDIRIIERVIVYY